MKKENTTVKNFLPKLAKNLGDRSMGSACCAWAYQPKVPDCMKKENKEK